MATCPKQNCDLVCGTFGLRCAKNGQSFPNTSALQVFESLGIKCKTDNYTDAYKFKDQPNYMAESPESSKDWIGRCLGFKSIPSTIDCHTASNSLVRRLCPCHDPSGRLQNGCQWRTQSQSPHGRSTKNRERAKNNLRAGPLGLNPLLVTMVTGLE